MIRILGHFSIGLMLFPCHYLRAQDSLQTLDTLTLTMAQYNELEAVHFCYAYGMTWGPGLDTVMDFGDSLCFPRDIKGWKHDYIFFWSNIDFVGRVYYDNGKLFKIYSNYGEGYYRDYLEYYENGQLKVQGQYCDVCPGVKSGTWNYYDENGNLLKTEISKRKKCNRGEVCN